MPKKLIALLISLLLLTGSIAATAAQTDETPKLGIAPVGANGAYFDLTMKPGESRELTVRLGNFGKKKARARTYAADVYTLVNGGFGVKLADEPASGVTNWLDYAPDMLELKPGQSVERTFTVTVPADAKAGQHITSVAIENADPIKGSGSITVNQVNRQVIAVLITVPGPVKARLHITGATYKLAPGSASVLIAIENTGNVLLKPVGDVVVADGAGKEITRAQVAMDSVYAGTGTDIEVGLVQPLQAGTYAVSVTLKDAKTKVSVHADALPMTVANVDASGSPVAEAPKIAITSVGITELRDPATKTLQGVELAVAIDNPGPAIANARATLHVTRDGQKVEDFVLAPALAVPNGKTEVVQRYLPMAGWTPGTWAFSVTLDAVDPNSGTTTELVTASASTSLIAP